MNMIPELTTHPIPAFSDNYIWVLGHTQKDDIYIVDPGEAAPVQKYLEEKQLTPRAILVTHQHWDHVGGIDALVASYGCKVYGPAIEQVPQVDHPLKEGDTVSLWGEIDARVLETPGHLPDHICYFIEHQQQTHLFCADTLFSAGCGRMFRATPKEFTRSLNKIRSLPEHTLLYPAHEYTLQNLVFAQNVEPRNPHIESHIKTVSQLRKTGQPSLPSRLSLELNINPFLRIGEKNTIDATNQHVGQNLSDEEEVFAALRQWKNNF